MRLPENAGAPFTPPAAVRQSGNAPFDPDPSMRASQAPLLSDLVLVGGGHSHVGVLERFARKPLPGVRLTLICSDTHTPYSGMLPGYIAGHYGYDEVHIDLRRLAEFAGARFCRDEVVGLDREKRRVLCRDRPPLAYDRLSINIGSMPALERVSGAAGIAVPVKPVRHFNARWQALLERVRRGGGAMTIAIVGAGAGGVELVLAMQYRLRGERERLGRDPDAIACHLFSAGNDILPTHNAGVRRRFEALLAERGVVVHRAAEVIRVAPGELWTRSGEMLAADEIVWVTQASGAAWLRQTGLALDAGGFIAVHDSLQTTSDPLIFAAGDCAALIGARLEKAGVFAVRQGRPLAENLRRSLLAQPLRAWRPQRRWLALISTGDRHAIASRGAFHAEGAWVWRWKDWIDRRFMARFGDPPPLAASSCMSPPDEVAAAATRLSRVLAALPPRTHAGLPAGAALAIVRLPPDKAVLHTVCFCRAFIDDPWLFGRIAANQALGGLFAMGGEAQTALAIATLPAGCPIEETLSQMLAGAIAVFDEAGCALLGGHGGEGAELALGFAITGLLDAGHVQREGGMRPGEVLILGKALGTGTLFAARAHRAARGRWIDGALESMLQSNRLAARCLAGHGASACAEVGDGGLIGQLLEMTCASAVAAEVDLAALPRLAGAAETIAAGFLAALHAANRRRAGDAAGGGQPNHALLFDPQTAGGLLASVPAEKAGACLEALRALGYERAACIGRVVPARPGGDPVLLR